MIGAILGAAGSVGSALFSGIKSARAARKAKQQVEQQKAENTAWYNRRYNEDGTQRADAQRLLRRTQEAITNRNKDAAATQAVVGGTEESVAATKKANANALSETASAINAQADARKDSVEASYRSQDSALNNQLNNMELQRSQNIANAGSQAIAAFGKAASAVDAATADSGNPVKAQPSLTAAEKTTLDTQAQTAADNLTLDAHEDLAAQEANNLKKSNSIFDVARSAL